MSRIETRIKTLRLLKSSLTGIAKKTKHSIRKTAKEQKRTIWIMDSSLILDLVKKHKKEQCERQRTVIRDVLARSTRGCIRTTGGATKALRPRTLRQARHANDDDDAPN